MWLNQLAKAPEADSRFEFPRGKTILQILDPATP